MGGPSLRFSHLDPSQLGAMHETFCAAFSDYSLPARRTRDELEALMVRRGVRYDLSVGVFDGERMVAVMAVGLDDWRGQCTAYDIYTGVDPSHRGRGLAGEMFRFARPAVVAAGAECFLLEVLQANEVAVRAYRRTGFRPLRELPCLELPPEAVTRLARRDAAPVDPDVTLRLGSVDSASCERLWSWHPSWQNGPASMARLVDRRVAWGAWAGDRLVGYGIVLPELGDLPQLAVDPGRRRRGVGTSLLAALARELPEGRPLRALNIDGEAAADLAFLQAHGAREYTRQWEMLLELSAAGRW